MKRFAWDEAKNQRLKDERGVAFEDVLTALAEDHLLAVLAGKGQYIHQKQYVVKINDYPYVVPCVEDEETIFLKTIIPNRKLKYLLRGQDDE